MFDDPNLKKQVAPPDNLPTEPVDILAGAESSSGAISSPVIPKALDAGLLKKKMPEVSALPRLGEVSAPSAPTMYAMKEPVLGKIILFIFIAALLGGLGAGGWWLYGRLNAEKTTDISTPLTPPETSPAPVAPVVEEPQPPVEEILDVSPAAPTEPSSSASAEMSNDQVLFGEPIDSDKDGLDDVREQEIGTNPKNTDTDGDGLSDGDEVLIWKTDPLNPDTDKDGYLDGDEVRHGYNPLGPGKLFNIPASPAATNTGAATPAQ